jgi:pilus assembly protein CpaF
MGKPTPPQRVDPHRELKEKIHKAVIDEVQVDVQTEQEALQEEIEEIANRIIDTEASFISRAERQRLVADIIDEVLGFGPINSLLEDETVSEVMVNGPRQVY